MKLEELIDRDWKGNEKKRFLKDDTKSKTDDFDPESFKHEGFDDREKYRDRYVPALAADERLDAELNDFEPPRLRRINESPYQTLVIRYGILRTLMEQDGYCMDRDALLGRVQAWQLDILETTGEDDFDSQDDLLHLSKAAVSYGSDVDDSELNMIFSYFSLHNAEQAWKHEHYTWLDVFERLAAIDRFPKVSRSEKPEHALDTIKQGLWSLQEQALVYEVKVEESNELVGIPEDYVGFLREWLPYEMARDNYLQMLESIDAFDSQSRLVDARETFGVDNGTGGRNDRRRESLVNAGIYPSDLLSYTLEKSELKDLVDRYGLDAHKRKTDEMIDAIISYFERSQKSVEDDVDEVELYLEAYEDISDGHIDRIPPQLQDVVAHKDPSNKMDVLFEEATANIFEEVFNFQHTTLLGQTSSGIVADGEVRQDGKWLLWDNKRRTGQFKLDSDTQSKIKNYVDTKSRQHDVEWFVIIAPAFAESAIENADLLEMDTGVDMRLLEASELQELARHWEAHYDDGEREFPLNVFNGSNEFDVGSIKAALDRQFS